MSKQIPYFKFYTSEWLTGDITLESYKTQGFFINLCAYYWSERCDLTQEKMQKRFKNCKVLTQKFLVLNLIEIKNDKIRIKFLDDQWASSEIIKAKNRINGAKGGRPKKTQSVSDPFILANPNESHSKDKDKDRIKKDNKKSFPPTLEEVNAYCLKRKNSVDPQMFLDHYEANGWMRGKTKIKSWEACVRTWEKNTIANKQDDGYF